MGEGSSCACPRCWPELHIDGAQAWAQEREGEEVPS